MECKCGNKTNFYGEAISIKTIELPEDASIECAVEKVCSMDLQDGSDNEWKIKCFDCDTEQTDA